MTNPAHMPESRATPRTIQKIGVISDRTYLSGIAIRAKGIHEASQAVFQIKRSVFDARKRGSPTRSNNCSFSDIGV